MDDDILIDDGDPRNARMRIVRQPGFLRPGTRPVAAPVGAAYYRPPAYAPPVYAPPAYAPPAYAPPAYAPPVYYTQAPAVVSRGKRILDLPTGEVLAIAAQAFAAFQALPAAPSVVGKADDDAANLILYQAALATHAKRDEQLRTIGALVAKLLA